MTDHREPADPLISVLDAVYRAGNPVPGGDPQRWPEITRAARRRWNSFRHRHPVPAPDTRRLRVEDLSRGLLVRCAAGGRRMVELSECREVARLLAEELGAQAAVAGGGVQ